jgi:hypothetical protein
VSKRPLLLPCLLIPLAFFIAACGSGGGEESKVEEAIETAATTTNPADCTKTQTQKFLEQTNGESGSAALKNCEKETENKENAESVEISNVEVDGSNATAEVVLVGGKTIEGQTLEVALIKDGDQWKLSEVVKFTNFDKVKLVESLEREVEKSGEASSKFATCIIEAFKRADQAEVEELFFFSSGKDFEEMAKECS